MYVSVTLYESSGLSPGNSMESLEALQLALAVKKRFTFNQVALKQDKWLPTIRLNVAVDQARALDYAVIGQVCYWITDISWANDDCAILSLMCDVITTVGIDNIEVLGGWCIRRHVDVDTPFSNVLPEPFTPTEPFVIVRGGKIKPTTDATKDLNLVLATTDLSVGNADPLAEPWKVPADIAEEVGATVGVFTPRINPLDLFTIYHMDVWNGEGALESRQTEVPYTAAFNIDSPTTQRNLATIYALGLDNVIQQAYILPKEYIGQINYVNEAPEWPWWSDPSRTDYTLVDTIKCFDQVVTSDLSPTAGNYNNSKVFSGQFSKVVLLSLTSGEEQIFDVEDIVGEETPDFIFWRIVADVRYNGGPMAYPQVYKGTPNMAYLGVVKGAAWQTAPIKQTGDSGYLERRIERTQGFVGNAINEASKAIPNYVAAQAAMGAWDLNTAGEQLSRAETQVSKGAGVLARGVVSEISRYTIGSGYNETHVPSLPFNQLPSMQNYFGNDFYDYMIKLSEGDMRRFDDFLTQFGYHVNERFKTSFFRGRRYFNFVQAESISIRLTGMSDMNMVKTVKAQLEAGIRIWHVLPDSLYMTSNPIGEVS